MSIWNGLKGFWHPPKCDCPGCIALAQQQAIGQTVDHQVDVVDQTVIELKRIKSSVDALLDNIQNSKMPTPSPQNWITKRD